MLVLHIPILRDGSPESRRILPPTWTQVHLGDDTARMGSGIHPAADPVPFRNNPARRRVN
jgi:hypothetical protein